MHVLSKSTRTDVLSWNYPKCYNCPSSLSCFQDIQSQDRMGLCQCRSYARQRAFAAERPRVPLAVVSSHPIHLLVLLFPRTLKAPLVYIGVHVIGRNQVLSTPFTALCACLSWLCYIALGQLDETITGLVITCALQYWIDAFTFQTLDCYSIKRQLVSSEYLVLRNRA